MAATISIAGAGEATNPEQLFRQPGRDVPELLERVSQSRQFDVTNPGSNHLLVVFQRSESHAVAPATVLLAPGKRQTVALTARGNTNETASVKFRDLDATASYNLHGFTAPKEGEAKPADLTTLGLPATATGRELLDKGLTVKLAKRPHFVWVVYRKAN